MRPLNPIHLDAPQICAVRKVANAEYHIHSSWRAYQILVLVGAPSLSSLQRKKTAQRRPAARRYYKYLDASIDRHLKLALLNAVASATASRSETNQVGQLTNSCLVGSFVPHLPVCLPNLAPTGGHDSRHNVRESLPTRRASSGPRQEP